jgi:hypothetical protein
VEKLVWKHRRKEELKWLQKELRKLHLREGKLHHQHLRQEENQEEQSLNSNRKVPINWDFFFFFSL